MIVRGHHKCYFCNNNFEWQYTKSDANGTFVYQITGSEAKLYAKGKNDKAVVYEVVATCPECRTINKFDYEK